MSISLQCANPIGQGGQVQRYDDEGRNRMRVDRSTAVGCGEDRQQASRGSRRRIQILPVFQIAHSGSALPREPDIRKNPGREVDRVNTAGSYGGIALQPLLLPATAASASLGRARCDLLPELHASDAVYRKVGRGPDRGCLLRGARRQQSFSLAFGIQGLLLVGGQAWNQD